MEYTFTLKYQLGDEAGDVDALLERLGAAGCTDALVGIGQPGCLALEFTREAASVEAAMHSALADVRRAGLRLLEENEAEAPALRQALIAGLESGEPRPVDRKELLAEIHRRHGV